MCYETVLLEEGIEIALINARFLKLRMQYAQYEYLRYLLSHPKLIRDFFRLAYLYPGLSCRW